MVTASIEIGNAIFEVNAVPLLQNAVSDYHIHAGFEIQYVNSGKLYVKIPNGGYMAEEDSIVIIPPNKYHYNGVSAGDFTRYTFSFSVIYNNNKSGGSEYVRYNRILNGIKDITVIKSSELSATLKRIIALDKIDSFEKKCLYNSFTAIFLIDMLTYAENVLKCGKNTELSGKQSDINTENERRKYIIKNCISENYFSDNINILTEQALNMSPRNTARVIYGLFGKPLSELVLKYRMQAAKLYIENSNMPLCDIASAVGYNTYVAFFTAFKKFYGISPTDYKNKK